MKKLLFLLTLVSVLSLGTLNAATTATPTSTVTPKTAAVAETHTIIGNITTLNETSFTVTRANGDKKITFSATKDITSTLKVGNKVTVKYQIKDKHRVALKVISSTTVTAPVAAPIAATKA